MKILCRLGFHHRVRIKTRFFPYHGNSRRVFVVYFICRNCWKKWHEIYREGYGGLM